MKKTVLVLVLGGVFAGFAQSQTVKNPAPPQITVNPDLKTQEKEMYDSLKAGGGRTGVMTSTVVIGEDGLETVLPEEEPVIKGKTAPAKGDPKQAALKQGAQSSKSAPVMEKTAVQPEVVKSDNSALDAMDQGRSKNAPVKPVAPQVKRTGAAPDHMVPEAGVSKSERTVRTETIEKILPPTDEVIYASMKKTNDSGKAAGAQDEAIVIEAIQGVNEIVTIGKSDLNRFVTPFEKVKVRTAAAEDELVSKVDGNIVYLGATKRSGVFLTEVGSDRAISLTLVPDDVPPRDIYIKLNRSPNIPSSLSKVSQKATSGVGSIRSTSAGPLGNGTETRGQVQAHVDVVKDIFRELALGKIPAGYAMMPPKQGEFRCAIPGFRMRLGQSIEGGNQKIYVFRAENPNNGREAIIDEQYCYKRGVLAVSAWPDVNVPPSGASEIFVLVNMDDMVQQDSRSNRPSLIGRESFVKDEEQ